MYDYLPWGQASNVGTQYKEVLTLIKQIHSFEGRMVELEQLKKAERFIDEAFRDILEQSHFPCNSPYVAEKFESLRDEKEGKYPLDGTFQLMS